MRNEKNVGNCLEEMRLSEPDELGWEKVYKDGKLYEKKTFISNNCTARVYNPIPFKKRKTNRNAKSVCQQVGALSP